MSGLTIRTFASACLLINPIDYGALNGLGNILLFQGELDGAEFFVSSAIRCAKKDGADYCRRSMTWS